MKLTPIGELAKQAGIFVRAMHEKDTQHELICFRSISDLDQLRQAIISDFVNGLEPRAYTVRLEHSATDVLSWVIPVESWSFLNRKAESYTPIFDLSEWRNK